MSLLNQMVFVFLQQAVSSSVPIVLNLNNQRRGIRVPNVPFWSKCKRLDCMFTKDLHPCRAVSAQCAGGAKPSPERGSTYRTKQAAKSATTREFTRELQTPAVMPEANTRGATNCFFFFFREMLLELSDFITL